jgi:nitrogen-specific signal transduction histidine kinase
VRPALVCAVNHPNAVEPSEIVTFEPEHREWFPLTRMVRAGQPAFNARATTPVRQAALSPALPKLAHDLNNAITSINGFADLLLTRLPVNEPARACTEQIRKAGARGTMLVKALIPPSKSSPSVPATDPIITTQVA